MKEIAIVGLSGMFPGGIDLNEFSKNLFAGRCMISDRRPSGRGSLQSLFAEADESVEKVTVGGYCEALTSFDYSLFSISKKEAEVVDPQQRIVLHACWEALENAGYRPSSLSGRKIGMFIGASIADYRSLIEYHGVRDPYQAPGIAQAMIPNRASYFFNFKGPSEAIDTACSSSSVSIHRAINSISTGECEAALVGGVNELVTPVISEILAEAGMLSPNGRCFTFDERADGYIRGEGTCIFYLKPLEVAQKDSDFIYGVIKNTSVNHGGRSRSLTAPNPAAMTDNVYEAITGAGLMPKDITYIETHGTGTALGDAIEVRALKNVFNKDKEGLADEHCGLGAVKTNIGHLEAVSGSAGLSKVLMSLHNKIIPPNVNFQSANKRLHLDKTPFYIIAEPTTWDRKDDLPLRACVNCFGFGGSNATIVVEEYLHEFHTENSDEQTVPLLFSGRDKNEIRAYLLKFAEYVLGKEWHANVKQFISEQFFQIATEMELKIVKDDLEKPLEKLGCTSEAFIHVIDSLNDTLQLTDIMKHIADVKNIQLTLEKITALLIEKWKQDTSNYIVRIPFLNEAYRNNISLYNVSRTLFFSREIFPCRLGLLVSNKEDLGRALVSYLFGIAQQNIFSADANYSTLEQPLAKIESQDDKKVLTSEIDIAKSWLHDDALSAIESWFIKSGEYQHIPLPNQAVVRNHIWCPMENWLKNRNDNDEVYPTLSAQYNLGEITKNKLIVNHNDTSFISLDFIENLTAIAGKFNNVLPFVIDQLFFSPPLYLDDSKDSLLLDFFREDNNFLWELRTRADIFCQGRCLLEGDTLNDEASDIGDIDDITSISVNFENGFPGFNKSSSLLLNQLGYETENVELANIQIGKIEILRRELEISSLVVTQVTHADDVISIERVDFFDTNKEPVIKFYDWHMVQVTEQKAMPEQVSVV